MSIGSGPSIAAWCALAALVLVVGVDYVWEARRSENPMPLARRFPRVVLWAPLVSMVWLVTLAAVDHGATQFVWWVFAAINGGSVLFMTWAPAWVAVKRRRGFGRFRAQMEGMEHEQRGAALLVLVLIAASPLITVLGPVVLTVLSGDFQFALALSLTLAFALRCLWRFIVRRRFLPALKGVA
jgi:hypothetical protein